MTNSVTRLNREVGYKVFRAEVPRWAILESNVGFEPETAMKVARLDCRAYKAAIRYYGLI